MMFMGREDQGLGSVSERQPRHCPQCAIQMNISFWRGESAGERADTNRDVGSNVAVACADTEHAVRSTQSAASC